MANRSDEVFIYLRAIGAAKTRRDISSVASELERLESGTEGHTEAVEDLTEAQNKNTKATKANRDALADDAKATGKAADATSRYNTSLIKTNDQLRFFNKSLKWKTKQTQDDITATERAAKKSQAAAEKAAKESRRLADQEFKRKEGVWRKTVKARQQYEKEMTSLEDSNRKARQKKINDYIRRMEADEKRVWKIRNDSLKARLQLDREELKLIEKHNKAIAAQETIYGRARKKFTTAALPKFNIPAFARPGRIILISTLIMGILDLIPVVGTALNAMLAGSIGAINGLMPMFSIFGALPALILGGIQGMTVMTIVAKGIGKALKGSGVLSYWKDLGLAIQDAGAKDIEKTFGNLTQALMPTLMKQLVGTAEVFNKNIAGAAGWFGSSTGTSTVNTLLAQGNTLLDKFLGGLGQMGIAFFNMGMAGSSVLGTMLDDFNRLGTYLADITGKNQDGISDYMDRAWVSTKRASGVVGDFIASLYNIFKLSDPITKDLADGLERSAANLRKWTKSEKGIKAIKDYFEEMRPNLKALKDLAGTVVKALFRISRSDNFKAIADTMSSSLVPALERLIESLDGEFILILTSLVDNLSQIANSGAAQVIMDIGHAVADLFSWITGLYLGMSDTGKQIAIWSFVLIGFFGRMATRIVGSIMKIIGAYRLMRREGRKLSGMKAIAAPTMAAAAGGGKGSKGGSAVVAGGGGSNKPSGSGATAIVPGSGKKGKGPKAPRTTTGGAAGAGLGAGIGLMVAGPTVDALSSAARGFEDLDYKASVAMNSIVNGSRYTDTELNRIFSTNSNVNFTTFQNALDRVANPSKWTSFRNGILNVTSAVSGSTNPLDVAKAQFGALDTALTNLPYEKSSIGFGKIADQARNQKIPMDRLIELFPQLRDRMRNAAIQAHGTAGRFDDAAFSAHAMGGDVGYLHKEIDKLPKKTQAKIDSIFKRDGVEAAYNALAQIDGKVATTVIQTINRTINESIGADSALDRQLSVNYAGGTVLPGEMSLTGELGPEFTLDRSGNLGIVGLNGPQLFKPSTSTAIIPASATSNPLSGNYGQAPNWAKQALQGAANSAVASTAPAMSKGNSEAPNAYHIDFSGAQFGTGTDAQVVKEAVMKAIAEAERDKRERK